MATETKITPSEQLNATGTPSSTTFLRGDNSWNTPAGGATGGITTQALSGTTLTMTISSNPIQVFTGTTQNQIVTLPNTAAGTPFGQQWLLINQGTTATVTCNASGTGLVVTIAPGASAVVTATSATPTTVASWDVQYGGISIAGGKIVNFANSLTFAGTDGTVFTFPATSANVVAPAAPVNTLTANVNPTTASTKILSSNVIPASSMSAGTTFRIKAQGVGASVTSNLTMSLYMGTNGTTADVLISTATTSVTSNVWYSFDGLVTVRATGVAAAVIGACRVSVGTAGGPLIAHSVTTLTQSVNTTVANYVTLAQTNSTNTSTVTVGVITWAGA
jgi:hypothetical protein